MAPSFNMAVGNSWAHPTIPLTDIIESKAYMKVMQLIALTFKRNPFDSYFSQGWPFLAAHSQMK